jgi:hypothetical protein
LAWQSGSQYSCLWSCCVLCKLLASLFTLRAVPIVCFASGQAAFSSYQSYSCSRPEGTWDGASCAVHGSQYGSQLSRQKLCHRGHSRRVVQSEQHVCVSHVWWVLRPSVFIVVLQAIGLWRMIACALAPNGVPISILIVVVSWLVGCAVLRCLCSNDGLSTGCRGDRQAK